MNAIPMIWISVYSICERERNGNMPSISQRESRKNAIQCVIGANKTYRKLVFLDSYLFFFTYWIALRWILKLCVTEYFQHIQIHYTLVPALFVVKTAFCKAPCIIVLPSLVSLCCGFFLLLFCTLPMKKNTIVNI